jgi:hypothetical protein
MVRSAETALSSRSAGVAARAWRSVYLLLADYPRVYYPVMRRRGLYKPLLISDTTELVIEGYPRSGNTFAVAALQYAQARELTIARHTHAPAQVIEGVRRGLPVLVLVREPRDAAASLVIHDPGVSLEAALRRYIRFHSRIHRYHTGYVVGTFPEVTTNYAPVIERLNQAFRLSLTPFQHTSANCEVVFKILEDMERAAFRGALAETRVARPSTVRNNLKAGLMDALDRAKHRLLLEECCALYQQFRTMAAPMHECKGAHGPGS